MTEESMPVKGEIVKLNCKIALMEDLLKQARDMLDSWDEDYAPAPPFHFDLVEAIDKFLGENK